MCLNVGGHNFVYFCLFFCAYMYVSICVSNWVCQNVWGRKLTMEGRITEMVCRMTGLNRHVFLSKFYMLVHISFINAYIFDLNY
jgi:hypothetical protein